MANMVWIEEVYKKVSLCVSSCPSRTNLHNDPPSLQAGLGSRPSSTFKLPVAGAA